MFSLVGARGASYLELLFALAVAGTVTATAIPLVGNAMDEVRTGMAARYVAARIGATRLDAVRRSSSVALRFEPSGGDYTFAPYGDGNANGVRSADIRDGVDPVLGPFERLQDRFSGVRFELGLGLPDADGQSGTGQDGVRIGDPRILTMSSNGTASSGTLYIRGRRTQYAVRILGVTGRTRMLQYHPGNRSWTSR
jgi:type II secretory pathway pseudopilin PulG